MSQSPNNGWWLPVGLGIAAAVGSPLLQIWTGRPEPYIFLLTALILLFWWLSRHSRAEFGLLWGRRRQHAIALLYPVAAMGLCAALAAVFGELDPAAPGLGKLAGDLALMFTATWIGVLISEEGFFRGTLWHLSQRAGFNGNQTLIWTSIAFVAWHIAVPIIDPAFVLPAWQIPIYLGNGLLLGLAWGAIRLLTGSVLVCCSAHASWNALAYVLFGYGEKTGLLGIDAVIWFDPERGLLGLLVNSLVVYWLLNRAGLGTSRLGDVPQNI